MINHLSLLIVLNLRNVNIYYYNNAAMITDTTHIC